MMFKDYTKMAMKTNGCGKDSMYFLYALTGEIGELVDELKKVAYHNHEINVEKIIKEVGDILWAVAYFENIHEKQEELYLYDRVAFTENFKTQLLVDKNYIYSAMNTEELTNLISVSENNFREKLDVVVIKLLSVSSNISGEYDWTLQKNIEQNSVDVDFVNSIMLHNSSMSYNPIRKNLLHLYSILNFVCHSILNSSLDDAMKLNVEKLAKRYAGNFTSEKSVERADVEK